MKVSATNKKIAKFWITTELSETPALTRAVDLKNDDLSSVALY